MQGCECDTRAANLEKGDRDLVLDIHAARSRCLRPTVSRVRIDTVLEMVWTANGRATYACGGEQSRAQAHIIWRRIGSHDKPVCL